MSSAPDVSSMWPGNVVSVGVPIIPPDATRLPRRRSVPYRQVRPFFLHAIHGAPPEQRTFCCRQWVQALLVLRRSTTLPASIVGLGRLLLMLSARVAVVCIAVGVAGSATKEQSNFSLSQSPQPFSPCFPSQRTFRNLHCRQVSLGGCPDALNVDTNCSIFC